MEYHLFQDAEMSSATDCNALPESLEEKYLEKDASFTFYEETLSTHRKQPWKKLLYLKQPYPDNYVDESFLSQLKRNSTVAKYSYWKLANDFDLIAFHISNLILVILVFTGIYQFSWNPILILSMSTFLSICGFIYWNYMVEKMPCDAQARAVGKSLSIANTVKSSVIIIFMFLILSPVLKSLTKSTSSDSIWTLSFMLCFLNAAFHDYAMNLSKLQYKPILSANLSLSNALVLASRLTSSIHVFCFVLFAVQVNILYPLFDFMIRKHAGNLQHRFIELVLSTVVNYLLYYLVGIPAMLCWIFAHIAITIVLPAYFLFLQKYKNELQGPWDIAKPVLSQP